MCVIVWAWTAYIMKAQSGCVRRHERIHDTCHCASIPRSFFALLLYTPPCELYYFLSIYLSSFWLNNCVVAHSVTAVLSQQRVSEHHVQILNKIQTQTFMEILPAVMCCEIYKRHAVRCLSFSASRLILIMNQGAEYLSWVWSDTTIPSSRDRIAWGNMVHGTQWMDECSLKKQTYMKHDGM